MNVNISGCAPEWFTPLPQEPSKPLRASVISRLRRDVPLATLLARWAGCQDFVGVAPDTLLGPGTCPALWICALPGPVCRWPCSGQTWRFTPDRPGV